MSEENVQTGTEFELFAPFAKVDKQGDGTLLVHTVVNDETVDDEGEIVDYEAVKKASDAFMEWANVREMHDDDKAAGTVQSLAHDDEARSTEGILHIVDPVAVTKVESGVYKGTSLGGFKRKIRLQKNADGSNGPRRILEIDWRELSLVDRPSRGTARLTLLKRSELADPPELIEEVEAPEDVVPEPEPLEKSTPPAAAAPPDAADPSPEAEPASPQAPPPASGDVYLGEDGQPLAKRDVPTEERDNMKGGDFAGKDRSFPINKPADVAAAAASIGRAGSDNYSTDQLKSRIIAIAERKGADYVAKLPAAWKKEAASAGGDLEKNSSSAYHVSMGASILGLVNELIACEWAEAQEGSDEADDLDFLRRIQQAAILFIGSESAEIGTDADSTPEVPVAMAYATVIGDLAKNAELAKVGARNASADQGRLNQIIQLAIECGGSAPASATIETVSSPEILQQSSAGGELTELVPLDEEALLEKLSSRVTEALRPLANTEALEAMKGELLGVISTVKEELAKVAAQPVSGGPLRYAPDARRFAEALDARDGSTATPDAEVLALRKLASSSALDPIAREAVGKAAATAEIAALQQARRG